MDAGYVRKVEVGRYPTSKITPEGASHLPQPHLTCANTVHRPTVPPGSRSGEGAYRHPPATGTVTTYPRRRLHDRPVDAARTSTAAPASRLALREAWPAARDRPPAADR